MQGLMMNVPLLTSSILEFCGRNHGHVEVVSATTEGPLHRYDYAHCRCRVSQLAHALNGMGLEHGDRVATIAWNGYRHLELYYAISGAGAVCHTLNPRLSPEHIAFIVDHAEDRWLFVDTSFLAIAEKLAPRLKTLEAVVVMTDRRHMPDCESANILCYEDLLAGQPETFDWPELDENAACGLCYTSGTTGTPKGVLYSHRSTVLHAMALGMADVCGVSMRDTVMPVVPMFHVNAWGAPFCAPMVGAKLVFPGPLMMDGEALVSLINGEGVTFSLGVPTIWMSLLQYLELRGGDLKPMTRSAVGGAACPPAMIRAYRENYGVQLIHGWGMTETSPLGTVNTPRPEFAGLDSEQRHTMECKQGHGIFGMEMKITDENDRELPWDGKAMGRLKVRGPWVCSQYYRVEDGGSHDGQGWLDTGDMATIDSYGYMQITDRGKDLIKSGGEWISSVELETIAMEHAAVEEAAVIAIYHPKWSERPLLAVVTRAGQAEDADALRQFYSGKVPEWWVPDKVVFLAELPHTATGKVSKLKLREELAAYQPVTFQ